MPKLFKRYRPPNLIGKIDKTDRFRGRAVDRGYDWPWQQLSSAYRVENPFCEECRRRGRIELAKVVDHMVPVKEDPERRLDWDNLQSLCSHCHNVWKRRIEAYAKASNKTKYLAEWCKNPEKRPKSLQIPTAG